MEMTRSVTVIDMLGSWITWEAFELLQHNRTLAEELASLEMLTNHSSFTLSAVSGRKLISSKTRQRLSPICLLDSTEAAMVCNTSQPCYATKMEVPGLTFLKLHYHKISTETYTRGLMNYCMSSMTTHWRLHSMQI